MLTARRSPPPLPRHASAGRARRPPDMLTARRSPPATTPQTCRCPTTVTAPEPQPRPLHKHADQPSSGPPNPWTHSHPPRHGQQQHPAGHQTHGPTATLLDMANSSIQQATKSMDPQPRAGGRRFEWRAASLVAPNRPKRFGPTREWRNWQTRRIQVPVSERTWGFKSPLAHIEAGLRSRGSRPRDHARAR